jgi:hypothetical protein
MRGNRRLRLGGRELNRQLKLQLAMFGGRSACAAAAGELDHGCCCECRGSYDWLPALWWQRATTGRDE